DGSGNIGLVARFSASSTLGTGLLIDNGTVSGVNATSSSISFNIQGSTTLDPFNVASSSGTSLLRVTSAGRVGIGTTSPASLLQVAGDVEIGSKAIATAYGLIFNSGSSTNQSVVR